MRITLWENGVDLVDKDIINSTVDQPVVVVTSLTVDIYNGCRKKNLLEKDDHYWCNSCSEFIPSPFTRNTSKHPASEFEAMLRSASGSQMVKNILNELIGSSLIFKIRFSEYNIKDQGTNGFTTTKVFPVHYKIEGDMMLTHIDQMQATMEIHTSNTIYPDPIFEGPKILPFVNSAETPRTSTKETKPKRMCRKSKYVVNIQPR
ncbi:hypothetical protein IFM89_004141 [Coptis chinensis]|uniref:Replication factor A C-terminal domain-containing protein n=1 Tax=Coptis chinensis TaxID=261450 RepID=A0A835LDG3_9MAGN|nr:hypothetical protein IFM89_004141 [Coptis chinensis]